MNKRIALFLHQPKCSVQSGNGILKALEPYYQFKIFTKHEVEQDFFDNVDMIAVPGGIGDADSYPNLFKHNELAAKRFVARGGKYLGICMGAYWAGKHYLNLLDQIEPVQYITRPKTDTRRPHAKDIKIKWNGRDTTMFFYDGCALVGPGKCHVIANYANGDAMAIIQNHIGLIGCHPESEPHWYDEYSWMNGKYHGGMHHGLLLDFVNDLMKK
jgi:glutamine amidotransferase-like uncharacterized protein